MRRLPDRVTRRQAVPGSFTCAFLLIPSCLAEPYTACALLLLTAISSYRDCQRGDAGKSSRPRDCRGVVEPIDDSAIAVLAIERQGMAVMFVNLEGVNLALLLERLGHSQRLCHRHQFVGPAV